MIKWNIRVAGFIAALCFLLTLEVSASGRQITVFQQGDFYEWSIDLSDIAPGESVYLVLPEFAQVDGWSELSNKHLAPLFEYAMPRFELRYDTFDCWIRELILPKGGDEGPARGAGQIFGLPGQAKEVEKGTRGQEDAWILAWLEEKQRAGFEGGQFISDQIIQIELAEGLQADKRVLRFRSNQATVPLVYVSRGGQVQAEVVHLFTMAKEGMLLPQEINSELPQVNPYLLPPRVNQNRRVFQDSIIEFWERKTTPTLLYSWDIGTAGGDKCAPCIAPPPQALFLQELGVEANDDHLYIAYSIIPPQSERIVVSRAFETFQYVFQMNEPSKGYLQCQEAKIYLQEVEARKKVEEANLDALFDESLH